MAVNIGADVNELHIAWYLNGKKWTGGLSSADKMIYEQRCGELQKKSMNEYAARIRQAEVMSDKFLGWANRNGFSGVNGVYWTARSDFKYKNLPGDTSGFVEDSKDNPTDILIKFSRHTYSSPYLGLSAKSILGSLTTEAPVKNPGMKKIESFIKVPNGFQNILSEGVDEASRLLGVKKSGKYLDKVKMKEILPESKGAKSKDPSKQPIAEAQVTKILSGCRDLLFDKLKTMDDIDVKMYILDELLDTDKMPYYVKVTGRSTPDLSVVEATVDVPRSNKKYRAMVKDNGKMSYEKLGGGDGYTVGVKCGQTQIIQIRFKFSSTRLASGLKMSVAPWPGSIERGKDATE
jgi:hypothetical protein